MKKGVVITGPTGTVGMALIKKCIDEGSRILLICHKGSKRNSMLPKNQNIRVIETELEELDKIDLFVQKDYNVFYHLGWSGTYGPNRDNIELQLANISNTLKAVELAYRLGCRTFIGCGSQAEYGRHNEKLSDSTPAFPENGYGMAKLCAGQMSRIRCEQLGMKHVWTRILSVYGLYDRDETIISSTLKKMLKGEKCDFTRGEQMWDFLYSEDAANALWLISERPKHGMVYPLGYGKSQPLKDYIRCMWELTGCKSKLEFGTIAYGRQQVMYLEADISELYKDTGFIPEVEFADGIGRMIEWIRKNEEN